MIFKNEKSQKADKILPAFSILFYSAAWIHLVVLVSFARRFCHV